MNPDLPDLHKALMSLFYIIESDYYEGELILPETDETFRTSRKKYLALALEPLRKECDSLEEQFNSAFKLYEEAKEIFADCLASRPDEERLALYKEAERRRQVCGEIHAKWIKRQHHYEDEYERIEETLPKCPHCEDIEEERIEQMRESLYREEKYKQFAARNCKRRNGPCDCFNCESDLDPYS
jgi:hypothetical protein